MNRVYFFVVDISTTMIVPCVAHLYDTCLTAGRLTWMANM